MNDGTVRVSNRCRLWMAAAPRWVVVVAVVLLVVGAAPPVAWADQVRQAQWYLRFLEIDRVHKITQGEGVTVAVIDTGVDADHPDLAGAVRPGADFAIRKATPPDGRVDKDGHGTAMAGLIAGRGRGGQGILGIAPKATILPIRDADFLDSHTAYTDEAIRWAVDQGAQVISMSFGHHQPGVGLRNAIEYARRKDVVLVAAVGNKPKDPIIGYPAAYPGVIAVGGVDQQGQHAPFSVTGPEVDITAPAVSIISTRLNGSYATRNGTSSATAIVAGAAALIRAAHPNLSADEVAYRLTATATDKGPRGRDDQYGYGVLNLHAALTADLPPMPDDYAEPLPTQAGRPTLPPPSATPPEKSNNLLGLLTIAAGVVLLLLTGTGLVIWLVLRRR